MGVSDENEFFDKSGTEATGMTNEHGGLNKP